jgi:3-oxoacyl-[acyl-carrier-protein] synthase II
MIRRRVKITGIGPVTPAGIGRETFWNGILESVSRVRPFTRLPPECGEFVAAHMEEFNVGHYVDRTLLPKGAARHTLFAVAGAALALKDAGILIDDLHSIRSAIITGTSLIDFEKTMHCIDAFHRKGPGAVVGRGIYTANLPAVPISINDVLGMSAQTMVLQSSCCSGMDAIGYAADLVAKGEVDLAICGGTEAPLFRSPLLELRKAGLTPSTTEMPGKLSRPFDRWRTTGVVSEGAAIMVIEPMESPRSGYCEILGYAYANDNGSKLCGGLAKSGRLALAEARLRPEQVDVINAWGPGHKEVDPAEVLAMERLFGSLLPGIPAFSIKGSIGTPLGAAPAIQAAVSALALREGVIPPTVNWEYPDPACNLNLSARPREIAHDITLVNAHGLAGVNSSLILKRC